MVAASAEQNQAGLLTEKSLGENDFIFVSAPALQQVRNTPGVSRGVSRWKMTGGETSAMPASSLSRGGTNCPPRSARTGLMLLTPDRAPA